METGGTSPVITGSGRRKQEEFGNPGVVELHCEDLGGGYGNAGMRPVRRPSGWNGGAMPSGPKVNMDDMDLSDRREAQQILCMAQACAFMPVDGNDKAGLAVATLGLAPINGLRHPVSGDTTGWYIWCGEQFSERADFFYPICVEHMIEKLPLVADCLALPPGYRFLIADGYRDIWFDESLLRV